MLHAVLDCAHYTAGECRSCTWLPTPYDEQLVAKDAAAREAVASGASAAPGEGGTRWLAPHASAPAGFRNKAKMVVAGTTEAPTLGILDPRGGGVDLRDCALHTPGLAAALPTLAQFVTRAGLAPYDVAARRGELKHVLVTESPDGELMVRWVLRSTEAEARIRKHLAWLLEALPAVRVVTLNVQPAHAAVLEGEREIVLTPERTLPMRLPDVTLHLGPRSFFQTNTPVATALYARGREWVADVAPASVWDLYCGVGGFALHLAAPGRRVTGVEISAEAIASAEQSRAEMSAPGTVEFLAGDATAYAAGSDPAARPDLVVVNPPRRGLGGELAGWLERSGVRHVLYSSCNPVTLGRDLSTMASYRPVRGQVFDMFPQTAHAEALVLLERA
ncbi:23S rRNA (uracil(747)-C(5))-methyltransferase RlmC [Nocardioides sp. GY 10113]|uniref:23S rRNA (uracil(747)-C(5))-methyltransferase RlmC n=1 Tax=Nocardioides sp. GY 10113 TaxID=2569761 RepID=UPI0010A8016F|nr:23S rRNA (uracil(747)-C(5))-methyltransferase RlmC [Nocardioides sp. GY 10113]TIC83231.1 23S rRNA (uracil(747)-C(5))-methyltransferase RlmC [Nocardioides sp. GY 10113]